MSCFHIKDIVCKLYTLSNAVFLFYSSQITVTHSFSICHKRCIWNSLFLWKINLLRFGRSCRSYKPAWDMETPIRWINYAKSTWVKMKKREGEKNCFKNGLKCLFNCIFLGFKLAAYISWSWRWSKCTINTRGRLSELFIFIFWPSSCTRMYHCPDLRREIFKSIG